MSGEAKNEEMMRVKNTFVNMQGLGIGIYQSYPDIEKQGANLIEEIIYRYIYIDIYIDIRGTTKNY